MHVLNRYQSQPTQDGDGVKISRVADFAGRLFDPYLMIDELKSDDKSDYMGGFPPHPHRGIETFTYIIKGGFEHSDQLGNRKRIASGDVQWMSTGRGVLHAEMPLMDNVNDGLHGFQIWLNMPAKDKMNPPIYQDTLDVSLPVLENDDGAQLRVLAGDWYFAGHRGISPLNRLAGQGEIADLRLTAGGKASLSLTHKEQVLVYIHTGNLASDGHQAGQILIVDSSQPLTIEAGEQGAGVLLLTGKPIKERIVHMGPFVMNTEQQIRQAVQDYQMGKFGKID